jgi:urea-proton symporter
MQAGKPFLNVDVPYQFVKDCGSKCSWKCGVCIGCFVCMGCFALMALSSCLQVEYGEVTLASTGSNYPVLAGNLAAIIIGAAVCIVVSLIKPENCDWWVSALANQ